MARKRKPRPITAPVRRVGSLKLIGVRALQVGEAMVLQFDDTQSMRCAGRNMYRAADGNRHYLIAPSHYSDIDMDAVIQRVRESR